MGKSSGDFFKYPRTPHILGSKGTEDDRWLDEASSSRFLRNPDLVVEEKVDGTNTAIHFNIDNKMILQCRGHEITGGMHPQFDLFKSWAYSRRLLFHSLLGSRFILYGEWLYAKHQIFYNKLPHYFLEFDIFDKETRCFLDTRSRAKLLRDSEICSVPILYKGVLRRFEDLSRFITQSLFGDTLSEGLYLKIEKQGKVSYRGKFVRKTFVQANDNSTTDWKRAEIEPNKLLPGASIW